jgi:hypothetical protein
LPELIVVDVLGGWVNHILSGINFEVRVVSSSCFRSSNTLWGAHVRKTEQKLTVQVRQSDFVVIGHNHATFRSTSNSHKGKCLDEFTSKGTGSNHESLDVLDAFLDSSSENLDLVVVSAVLGLTVDVFTLRKSSEDIEINPLLERGVLSSRLDNFLANQSSIKGTQRRKGASRESCSSSNDLFVDIFNGLAHETFSKLKTGGHIFFSILWIVSVFGLKSVDCAHGDMNLTRAVPRSSLVNRK